MRVPASAVLRFSMGLAGALLSLAATAQTTPGQVGDTLKRPSEVTPAQPAPVETERKPAEAPPAAAAGVKVKVSGFQFKGNTVYSSNELGALLSSFLNRPVSLLDIYAAADVIADHYTGNGYTLASVNVPPQKISDGAVILEISEGRIGKISVEQDGKRRPERIGRYLGMKEGDIYRAAPVERGMLTLNDLPGMSARAVVKPGADFGTSDLIVRARDDRFTGAAFADNHGRESIGENRFGAAVDFNNPTGIDDQIKLLGLVSSGSLLKYASLGYNLPVDVLGGRLAASYGFADFESEEIPGATLTGDSKNARIGLVYPSYRSTSERLDISVGVSDTRTSSKFDLGVGPVVNSGTSITVAELGATYNRFYSNAAMTQVSAALATNFEDQTRNEVTAGANRKVRGKQMARIELDVVHVQPLPARFSVQVHANGVWSPDPLSDPSAYSIGGPQSVRGFPPSEVRGDRGYFGQLTLQQRYQLGPVRFVPRIFADSGKVSTIDPVGGPSSQSLDSIGIGADVQWKSVALRVDASDPQGSRVASDGEDSTRVFGTISVGF